TYFKVLKTWKTHSLVLLRPKTGRTHQLRVHLMYLGYPILGDPVYGVKDRLFPDASMMLHAKSLEITLPCKAERVFSSPLPERFTALISVLNAVENKYGH
ncbi:MAG: RluA family pseudouridine synthase, partial [Treponema sp.]|nr:RluA family pseudouridine synthase [Treponema sp.]